MARKTLGTTVYCFSQSDCAIVLRPFRLLVVFPVFRGHFKKCFITHQSSILVVKHKAQQWHLFRCYLWHEKEGGIACLKYHLFISLRNRKSAKCNDGVMFKGENLGEAYIKRNFQFLFNMFVLPHDTSADLWNI